MATASRSRLIRRIIYVLVGLVILGFIITRFVGKKPGPEYVTVKAENMDVKQTVELTGTTEPQTRYQVQFPKSGKISQILVKAGDHVKTGDLLAVLENGDAQYQLEAQKAALRIVQANLAKAVAKKRPEEITIGKLQVDLAKVGAASANTAKQDFMDIAEKSVNSAYLSVQSAKTALEQAKNQYSYTYKNIQMSTWNPPSYQIYDSGYYYGDLRSSTPKNAGSDVTLGGVMSSGNGGGSATSTTGNYMTNVNTIDNANFAVQKAQQAYDQAQEAYNKAVAELKNQSNQLDTAMSKANIGIKNAQEQYNLTLAKPRDVDIAPLEAQVDQAWQGVNLAQYQFDQTQLKAPAEGVITDIAQDSGEMTSLGQPLMTMDTQNLHIKALVSEADIAKIQVGQNTVLTFDALGTDKEFKGTVSEVNPSETIVQGVVYYVIKVQFDQQGQIIKPGMTSNLTIQTNNRSGVLTVPSRAIQYEGNQAYVQVLKTDGNKQTVEKRNVQIGLQGDENSEIMEGLQAGEDVVTFTKTT